MAEDTIDEAIKVAGLKQVACVTGSLQIHGYFEGQGVAGDHLQIYGSDAAAIRSMIKERPELNRRLHESFSYTEAEVVWAVHHEMARTIEDVLARRLRVLFLNARVAMYMAPAVAKIMALELGFDWHWQQDQLKEFSALAQQYLPAHHHKEAIGK